ncbi:MAG: hypothetical protein LQ340_006843 [Diploschistes diacapsis]|nr:MAG: hypothetical protein LQ340_006843 [Diploschistes diacapsis]
MGRGVWRLGSCHASGGKRLLVPRCLIAHIFASVAVGAMQSIFLVSLAAALAGERAAQHAPHTTCPPLLACLLAFGSPCRLPTPRSTNWTAPGPDDGPSLSPSYLAPNNLMATGTPEGSPCPEDGMPRPAARTKPRRAGPAQLKLSPDRARRQPSPGKTPAYFGYAGMGADGDTSRSRRRYGGLAAGRGVAVGPMGLPAWDYGRPPSERERLPFGLGWRPSSAPCYADQAWRDAFGALRGGFAGPRPRGDDHRVDFARFWSSSKILC